ncbi:MAG: phosphoribosyltransferase family protein, partial [Candidatus Aenigmatarchaeota archaeon]
VEGRSVVILDDIISTGGTMKEAAEQLREEGAEEVHAGCTHGLFAENALEKLEKVCDSVFCTDTIEQESSEISAAPLLSDIVK